MKKHIFTLLALAGALGASAGSNGLKVYINPGHGGHDPNDRNVVIAPYAQGDPNGYWESNSNLDKGLALRDMLSADGYDVAMSRVTNTSADDLGLSTIVRLGNESNADIYFSIHSNATGTTARRNFPLMLFRGYDSEPVKPQDRVICEILNKHLLENEVTYWTNKSTNIRGDFSFYPSWGTSGLGALRGLTVTGMLSEGSFHDYIPEAYRLMSKDFCWLEAFHFRKAIDEYFKQPGETVGSIFGRLNDARIPREGAYTMFGDDKFATIQNAVVTLYDADGKELDSYTTDPIHLNGVYAFRNLTPGKYTVKATTDTHYPIEAEVEVVANEIAYANLKMNKVRSTPPEVTTYSPVWAEGDEAVLCNTPIVLDFNWDMDTEATEAAFSTEPATKGEFTWEDTNHRMIFTPSTPYNIGTVYTVTLSTEAQHAGGMKMTEPFSFKFLTADRNFMEIIGQFPKQDEEVHYSGAAVEFRFDHLPNTTPILKQISCTSEDGETVAFNNRKLTNSKVGAEYGWFRLPFTKDLTPGKTYRLQLSNEVADKDGLTIQNGVDITFKAVDASDRKDVQDFDFAPAAEALVYDQEASINVESAKVTEDKSLNIYAPRAVTITYAFGQEDAEAGELQLTHPSETVLEGLPTSVTSADVLGVPVYGDLSGNELYLQLSSETAPQMVKVTTLDFLGWRYVTVPLSGLESTDPYTLAGVKIVRVPGQASRTGVVKLDQIHLLTSAGVENVIAAQGLSIYPNPASEYLIANGDVVIESLDLFGVNGMHVARVSGNVMNVSEIPAGAYICVISTGASRTAHKVTIVH